MFYRHPETVARERARWAPLLQLTGALSTAAEAGMRILVSGSIPCEEGGGPGRPGDLQKYRSQRWKIELLTLLASPSGSILWIDGARALTLGDAPATPIDLGVPYGEPSHVSESCEWRAALRQANPWRDEPPDVIAAVSKAIGHSFEEGWRELARCRLQEIDAQGSAKVAITARDKSEEVRVRRKLRSLLGRRFSLGCEDTHLVFRLRVAIRAPLVCLTIDHNDIFDVVANMGAGHLLRIRALRFSATAPAPFQGNALPRSLRRAPRQTDRLDGGDVVITFDSFDDRILEGGSVVLPAGLQVQDGQPGGRSPG